MCDTNPLKFIETHFVTVCMNAVCFHCPIAADFSGPFLGPLDGEFSHFCLYSVLIFKNHIWSFHNYV